MGGGMKFEEKFLETDRLRLVRIKGETHGAELNQVICDTADTLTPWMQWCKEIPPTVEVKLLVCIIFNVNFTDQTLLIMFVSGQHYVLISFICFKGSVINSLILYMKRSPFFGPS